MYIHILGETLAYRVFHVETVKQKVFLISTGVDVNDITTSDKNLNAAKKLSATIGKSGITAATKKTDSNGKVSFTDLPQGSLFICGHLMQAIMLVCSVMWTERFRIVKIM